MRKQCSSCFQPSKSFLWKICCFHLLLWFCFCYAMKFVNIQIEKSLWKLFPFYKLEIKQKIFYVTIIQAYIKIIELDVTNINWYHLCSKTCQSYLSWWVEHQIHLKLWSFNKFFNYFNSHFVSRHNVQFFVRFFSIWKVTLMFRKT